MGYSVGFAPSTDIEGNPNVMVPAVDDSPGELVIHKVVVTSVSNYLKLQLGIDTVDVIDSVDWLTFPEQKLLSLTGLCSLMLTFIS